MVLFVSLVASAALAWDGPASVASQSEPVDEARASSHPERRVAPPADLPVADAAPPALPWTVALGGQVRVRGDFTRNQSLTDFSFTPGDQESQFLERTRLGVSGAIPALDLRLFVQGQWYGRWGGRDDESDLDLYQGYIEYDQVLGVPLRLKLGRQELAYGTTFFLGTNDFYNGLTWDGVKASVNATDDLLIDVLAARMAELNAGDPAVYLTGLYGTYALRDRGSLAAYLFLTKGGFPVFHREVELEDADQRWFTLGTRFAGVAGALDYELEPQFQWGRVRAAMGDGTDEVRAYGGHVDVGYTFAAPWQPRLFAAYAFGSGHDDGFDGTYGEFHGDLFNDDYLVGDMSIIPDLSGVTVDGVHASGIHVLVAGIAATPFADFTLNLDAHRFRASDTPAGFSDDLGVEVDLVAAYQPVECAMLLLGLSRFWTGRFFEQASGSNSNASYLYIQAQVDF